MTRAPFGYYGGKYYLLPTLLPMLPLHRIYCEVFGGAGWLLLGKDRAPVEVYNDLWQDIVNFYRVLRDPEQAARLKDLLELTPYARAEYHECRKTFTAAADPVECARRWFVVARQSFAGRFGIAGWSYTACETGALAMTTSKWLGSIALLPEIHQRLQGVQIECQDWRIVLDTWDSGPDTLIYCDPPYVHDTRRGGRGYTHEMSDDDHRDLVARLLQAKSRIILSGYANALYAPLEAAGWRRIDIPTSAHSAGRTRTTGLKGLGRAAALQPRVETIWLNYDPSVARGQARLFGATEGVS